MHRIIATVILSSGAFATGCETLAPATDVSKQVAAPFADERPSPATLFSEARILPKYDNGKMVGITLFSIMPGGFFDQMGLKDQDTIVVVNEIQASSPEATARLLQELTKSNSIEALIVSSYGSKRLVAFDPMDYHQLPESLMDELKAESRDEALCRHEHFRRSMHDKLSNPNAGQSGKATTSP